MALTAGFALVHGHAHGSELPPASMAGAYAAGMVLATALLQPLWARLRAGRRRKRALDRAVDLDWKVIDQTLNRERTQRDCERPETLGICTGRDCLVYDQCNFNIKKPA